MHASRGFSLIELMIGVALGLVILAALTTFFVSSSATRSEIERTSRQIENGRFAIDALRNEIHLAGFFAEIQQTGVTWQMPDPCGVTLADMGFRLDPAPPLLPLPISGYAADAAIPGCLTDWVKGTDVLVIRRLHTEAIPAASAVGAQFYFQPSRCRTDSNLKPWAFDSGGNAGVFDLHKVDCKTVAELYRYRVTVFYLRSWSFTPGEVPNIPTLVKVELDGGVMNVIPIVEGIQDMRFEYGLDTTGDGTPDEFRRCDTAKPCTPDDWINVTTVRAHVLAVNHEDSVGYKDDKVYDMGSGNPRTVGPFGDRLRRHIYAAVVSAPNRTGPRE
jgi:type IV pilus assembly protein PilW